MLKDYSLKLTFPTGDSKEATLIEVRQGLNDGGNVLKISRELLEKKSLKKDISFELDSPGIYLLVGEDNETYVGQANSKNGFLARLNSHLKKKAFFKIAYLFYHDRFGATEIDYLESTLIRHIKDKPAGCKNTNASIPNPRKPSNARVLDKYVDFVGSVISIFGVNLNIAPQEDTSVPTPDDISIEELCKHVTAQNVAYKAFRRAIEMSKFSSEQMKYLLSKESAKEFKTGGFSLLSLTHIEKRYKKMPIQLNGADYFICSQLYNGGQNGDSRVPLIKYLNGTGFSNREILEICSK